MRDPDEYDPEARYWAEMEPEPPWCRECGDGAPGCPVCDPVEPPVLIEVAVES